MPDPMTPERLAELRVRAELAKPFVGHDFVAPPFTTIDAADLHALLGAADERDRLAGALVRAQGPFACCSHCEGDTIHDVEMSAHEVPCTLCQSSVGEVERLRDVRDQLAAAAERVRALHYQYVDSSGTLRPECECGDRWPCPTVTALDGDEQ